MISGRKFSRVVLGLLIVVVGTSSVRAQRWTVLNNQQPGVRFNLCLLLTDASVICQASHDWYKLTPDLTGSYTNGTWTQIASFPPGYEPFVYSSAVLPDGRVVVVGGEYDSSGNIVLSNQGAIYDPVANLWTSLAPPAGWNYIGDAPATVLADGRFLIGSKLDTRMAVLDPTTLTWTAINPIGKGDAFNSEEGWTLLPDGTVFTVDVATSFGSERFFPSTSTWVTAGLTPVEMRSPPDEAPITIAPGVVYTPPGDMGPALLCPDGTVFAIGGDGYTAIYTPPQPGSLATGSWVQGPDIPGGLWVDDGPGALLPNGHVLVVASPPDDNLGLSFFEFDGATMIPVPANPNASADASNFTSLLLLPTGQVLLVDGSGSVQIYSPGGTYNLSWAPAVSSVPPTLSDGTTYQIVGTQFNGLSQGSAFGDEYQNATNYPLVRITNNASGHVYYARTHGHSSMGVATGAAPVSTNFDLPANTELGAATLSVVANGIPSAGVAVSIASATPPPVALTCPAIQGVVGIPYSSALVGSGGQPPFTYSIQTGVLPSGLGLTIGTGAITGTPGTPGVSNFTAQAADSLAGTQTANCTITITPPPAVTYQLTDSNTQGNWKGVYGGDGYIIANNDSNNQLPSYATVSVTGASTWTWVNPTSDPRGLFQSPSATNRIASTYFSGTNFTFDVNLTGGQHTVAFYLLDFDSTTRAQSLSIIDAETNEVLDNRSFANYSGGVYAVWSLQGHVLINVTCTGGLNAVVSGLFFGPAGGVGGSPGPFVLASNVSPPAGGTIVANPLPVGGSYAAGTVVQLIANPASGCTFVNWSGALSGATNPQTATMSGPLTVTASFSCTPPGGTAFVTAFALNNPPLRNDFTGWVGMEFMVGANPLTLSSLGRLCVTDNAQLHAVKLVNPANGADIPGASVSVNMAGCTPGQFVFSALALTLPANTSYYLASQETQGGDKWYDQGQITTTNVGAVNTSVYFYNGNWYPIGVANTSYVPPNFQYTAGTPTPIPVTVQTSPTGYSFSVDGVSSSTTQNLSWTPGSSHTIGITSPQGVGAGTQSVWTGWSDGGAISHVVAPTGAITFTAFLSPQYWLSTTVAPAGSGTITAVPSSVTGYYDTGTTVQLMAVPGNGSTFANWTGDLSGSTNPQQLTMTTPHSVSATFQQSSSGGGSATAFVTAYDASRPVRNDYSGWVGAKVTVGSSVLNIGAIGRVCVAGNFGTHMVKFVAASTGQDVPGGSALVNMAGCTPGQFSYGALPGTLTLQPGAGVYLVSQESVGGDGWYDMGAVSTTPDAAVISAIYSYNGSWISIAGPNTSYVPPNFQYSLVLAPPIPVTVQTNIAGALLVVDGTTWNSAQLFNWPAGSSHTIAVASPQSGGTGAQYVWNSWSDGGAISHTVAPTSAAIFTANLSTQYLLGTSVSPAGSGTVVALPPSATGYYSSGTTVQLTATPGAGATFLNWSGDLSGTTNPQTVTMTAPHAASASFQPPAGSSGTAFLTGFATNGRTARNDYPGWVGMKLTIGSTSLSVSSVGRICLAGNSGLHAVKFVSAGTGQDVPGSSATLSMAGCTPGQFLYAPLPGSITLQAGAVYYLVSQEVAGGDSWYDLAGVSATSAATVDSAVYFYNGSWITISSANTSYVPPSFQYLVTP